MLLLFVILILINIFMNYQNLIFCIYDSLFIWFYNIYPSIFLFYNISNYLIYNSLFNKISNIFSLLIKLDSKKAYCLLCINIFLGNPGTTNLIYESYSNNEISEKDFMILNDICFFMNPLFILYYIDIKYYLIYLLSSFIYIKIYSFFIKRKKYNNDYVYVCNEKYSYKIFSKSLNDVIYILLNIASLITFFNILRNTIIYFLSFFNLDIKLILSFLEIASGLKILSIYKNISLFILLISFQGICVLMQSYNIISKKNISLIRYILVHIISSLGITIIFTILTTLFHI